MNAHKRGGAYTREETAAVALLYVGFAIAQIEGRKVNKSALIKALIEEGTVKRSRGSIEAKLMNFSAVAVEFALFPMLPGGHVQGYKPAPNYARDMVGVLKAAIAKVSG